MRALAALALTSFRQLLASRVLLLFAGLGILVALLACGREELSPEERAAGRVDTALALTTMATVLVAAAAGAGTSWRDRQSGHLDFLRIRAVSGVVSTAGTSLSVLALALVAWVVAGGVALGCLVLVSGPALLGEIGTRSLRRAVRVDGGAAGQGPWLLHVGERLTFVFASGDLGSHFREGRLACRFRRPVRLPAGESSGPLLDLERGGAASRGELARRGRGEWQFSVPQEIAGASGELRVTLGLPEGGAGPALEVQGAILLGARAPPWARLGSLLAVALLGLIPVVLLACALGHLTALPLATAAALLWCLAGLMHTYLAEAERAEIAFIARTEAAHQVPPESSRATRAALALATVAAPDLSFMLPEGSRDRQMRLFHSRAPRPLVSLLLWDLGLFLAAALAVGRRLR
ncbi:MAG: hypothetical protein AB1486_09120 [Planctomycetota bacterium]